MFGEFKERKGVNEHEDEFMFTGDVKYHLGASKARTYPDGSSVNITILPNPSHLETVNTVTMGCSRSKMDTINDLHADHVLTC